MNLTCIFFGIIFTIAGFMFACGKGHIHFSSWKNMPQEEKEKIKIVPLCRNIGEVIALNGLIFLLKGLWTGFENHWFVTAMNRNQALQLYGLRDKNQNDIGISHFLSDTR